MSKNDSLVCFLAGFGVGAAAAVLLVPEAGRNTRHRVGDIASRAADTIKTQAANLRDAAGGVIHHGKSTWTGQKNKKSDAMSDLEDRAKEKIDDAADAAKKAAETVIDKSKDAAHSAGKTLEEGGKQLQDA